MFSLTPDEIAENFEHMRKLCAQEHLGDRSKPVLDMLDYFGMRLAVCPGSAKVEYHNAFPGGLVEHSLRVLDFAMQWITLNKKVLATKPKRASLTIACLFHDFGKVGDHEVDYYIPLTRDNEWKREKYGQQFEYNQSIPYMTVPQRGLWLLQHFGVRLTHDEYLAILLNDGQYCQENKPYAMKEPDLAIIVHQADLLATRFEKDRGVRSMQ